MDGLQHCVTLVGCLRWMIIDSLTLWVMYPQLLYWHYPPPLTKPSGLPSSGSSQATRSENRAYLAARLGLRYTSLMGKIRRNLGLYILVCQCVYSRYRYRYRYMCVDIYICVWIYVCMDIYYVNIYVYVYIYMYIYMYIYIYILTAKNAEKQNPHLEIMQVKCKLPLVPANFGETP